MAVTERVDFLSPEFRANPYPTFARLREQGPVVRVTMPGGHSIWVVTQYEAVVAVLKDNRFIKDPRKLTSEDRPVQLPGPLHQFEILSNNMLRRDPPDHTRLRALVAKAFTPRRIEQLAPRIQEIADELLDVVQDREEIDLIDSYAFPLPIIVISELLGIPVEDRDKFREWSDRLVNNLGQLLLEEGQLRASSSPLTLLRRFAPWRPERMQLLLTARAFIRYFRGLIAQRRVRPTNDLVSALVQVEEEGERLTEEEMISMLVLLLLAGHETTVNLIGNGTLLLLQNPAQLAHVRQNPAAMKSAVEEILRAKNPVNMVSRIASEDIILSGERICKGDRLLVAIASANHDEAVFKDAEELDVLRKDNRHVGFGQGIHFCLGAPLARLEGQIALDTLLRRFPEMALAVSPEALRWRPGFLLHGMQELPVKLQARDSKM
jgi:cytochrome P450